MTAAGTVAPPASTDAGLAQRVRAVADVLLVPSTTELDQAPQWTDVSDLLVRLVADLQATPSPSRMWLLLTAVSTVLPDAETVRESLRYFELATADDALYWLLESCLAAATQFGNPDLQLRIVQDAVVVEVDFTARFNLHTGIQRVTRSLLPLWDRDHDIVPVAWAPGYGVLRTLAGDETERTLRWHGGRGNEINRSTTAFEDDQWSLLVPWNCVVVLPEVPIRQVCERLAALAEHSGNRLVAIGYDCIPVISADLVPADEPNRFVRYLSIVKHMRRVAGISISATTEFHGFAAALDAQGLAGPDVVACPLPSIAMKPRTASGPPAPDGTLPAVLCVGSFEPRKNQTAVLYAAETLWREGLRFAVHLVGGGGWDTELPALVKRLQKTGRAITVSRAISDSDLEQLFESARFSVLASVHEGYGLPVAESLSFGLPAITTDYGSTAEIAAAGGTILVDPRNDAELTDAMRRLLTDDELLATLRRQTADIPSRTWDDYARDLWQALVVEPAPADS